MEITRNIHLKPNKPDKLAFGTTVPWSSSTVNPETGTKLNPETYLFRWDMDWKFLAKTIKNHFPNGTKIHCYAGSDGSEAYSLAMKLIDMFGKVDAEKFFPISSIDLNDKEIIYAKSGIIGILDKGYNSDVYRFKDNIKHTGFDDYFIRDLSISPKLTLMKSVYGNIPHSIYYHHVAEDLKEKIEFKKGNILEDTKNKFEEPCVIMFRNAWYLLEDYQIEKLANNLSSNLPKGSLVVIGSTDNEHLDNSLSCNIDELLEKNNFKKIKKFLSPNCYTFEKI